MIIKRGMLVVCSVVIPLLAAWQIVRGVISDEMIQPADRQTVVDGVAMTDNMDSDGDGFSDEREGLWGSDPHEPRSVPMAEHGTIANWPLTDGAGLAVRDLSPNQNTGQLAGVTLPTWENDGVRSTLKFDGVQNEVHVAHAASLVPSNELTIVVWVKSVPDADGMVAGKWSSDGVTGSYSLALLKGHPTLELSLNGVYVPFTASAVIADTEWHQLAASYNGREARLYLDGRRIATTHVGGIIDTPVCPLVMGQHEGTLEGVRIFDRTLRDGQIRYLYSVGAEEKGLPRKRTQVSRLIKPEYLIQEQIVAVQGVKSRLKLLSRTESKLSAALEVK